MPLVIEAKDIAVGDYSPTYGTVMAIKENKNRSGDVLTYDFTFFSNDYVMSGVSPDLMLPMIQGGADIMHNGLPNKSQIRPGLKADHASD